MKYGKSLPLLLKCIELENYHIMQNLNFKYTHVYVCVFKNPDILTN